jgi:hypothetical protein
LPSSKADIIHASRSLGCGSSRAQSIVRPSSRGGVPEANLPNLRGKRDRGTLALPPAFDDLFADEQARIEKSAGCNDQSAAAD